jgi:RNA polymerase sigma-70 factor (ECF subfamily)
MTGDRDAMETLFASIRQSMVRYCRSRIGGRGASYQSAEDVAQEICMAALGALTRYCDDPDSFLPCVYGIAAHKVIDHYRRTGRDYSVPTEDVPEIVDPDANPEHVLTVAHRQKRLGELLDTLPPQNREILILRLIMGLSSQETARAMGLTPNAVRVRQHRALNKLREALSPADEMEVP